MDKELSAKLIDECKSLIDHGADSEDIDDFLKSEGLDVYQQAKIVGAIRDYQVTAYRRSFLSSDFSRGRLLASIIMIILIISSVLSFLKSGVFTMGIIIKFLFTTGLGIYLISSRKNFIKEMDKPWRGFISRKF